MIPTNSPSNALHYIQFTTHLNQTTLTTAFRTRKFYIDKNDSSAWVQVGHNFRENHADRIAGANPKIVDRSRPVNSKQGQRISLSSIAVERLKSIHADRLRRAAETGYQQSQQGAAEGGGLPATQFGNLNPESEQ